MNKKYDWTGTIDLSEFDILAGNDDGFTPVIVRTSVTLSAVVSGYVSAGQG